MDLTDELKKQIDSMSYESMLNKWRFAPVGDSMFQGDSGDYFAKVMGEKREAVSDSERVRASKDAGWG